MTYYKVTLEESLIGIGTENNLRRYQKKHNTLLICGIEDAEYIEIDGALYHDAWLETIKTDTVAYTDAEITAIEAETYEALAESIELGEEILSEIEDETEDTEDTDTTAEDAVEAITKVGYLERLEALEEAVLELAEEVANG